MFWGRLWRSKVVERTTDFEAWSPKPWPGRPGLYRRRGVGGAVACLQSEFMLTVASLSVPPHSIAKDHHGAPCVGSLQLVQRNRPGFAEALDRLLRGIQQVSCQRPGIEIEQFGQSAHWQTDVASVEEFEFGGG